ncbi:MAG: hypothetical protein JST32_11115 [Bacteroidetes bacterium]|nr:hypothetical protein [Bacteroidota bacterium]
MTTRREVGNKILVFAICISIVITGCSEPSGIYIDIKKEAIVSCDGIGLKEVRIEDDSSRVVLEGTQPIIYFHRINPVAKTSIYGDAVYNFELKLKPHCSYKVIKPMGFDRGTITITFRTDSSGKIITASNTNCN